MNIFLNAPYFYPGGPSEVNRNLVKCLKDRVTIQKIKIGRIRHYENLWKILKADVVVFSGLMYGANEVEFAKHHGKKIIYIMHGCLLIETGHESEMENEILEKADLILCVSKTYRDMISRIFPQYADKMEVLMNGVNWQEFDDLRANLPKNQKRDGQRIILFGGGRTTKKNLEVCQAVEQMNEEDGTKFHVDVYGYFRESDDSQAISEIPCVTFHHVIPHAQVNIELAKSQLFIQNSEFEPFSLALMDALQCGCNVLLSKNVGAQDIIGGKTDMDIVQNPSDIDELKLKIRHVMTHPNNKRLLNSIDRQSTSIETAAENLMNYCRRYEK